MNRNGVSKRNKEWLEKFEAGLNLTVQESTRKLQMGMLYNFARIIKKDFDIITRDDIVEHFNKRKPQVKNKKQLKDRYIEQEYLYVTKLFKFIGRPEVVEGIFGKKKNKNIKLI